MNRDEAEAERPLPSAADIAARRAEAILQKPDEPNAADASGEVPADAADSREGGDAGLRHRAEEADRYLDALRRTQADFDNYRKRVERDRDRERRRARGDLVAELLDVIDKFHLSMDKARTFDDPARFLEAMRIVERDLAAFMERVGLARIETAGAAFDPALHEALMHVASDTAPSGRIVDEVRAGYRLGDLVIRPSQVVVSKGAEPARETAGEEGDA